jgi:Secretion system C-terminal sorting domain
MKFSRIFSVLCLLTVAVTSNAATYFSRASAAWNVNTTWSTVSFVSAVNAGTFPVAGDIVNIGGGFSVTISAANAACTTLNINDGSTLTVGGFTLTVSGVTTVGQGASGSISINSATGTKTFTGNVIINAGASIAESAAATLSFGSDVTITGTLTENGAATVGVAGNFTNNGTYTASTGTHTFSGATKTLSGSSTTTIANAAITGTYTNSGTLTVSATLTGAGTLTNNGTLNLSGVGATSCTITTLSNAGTINRSATGTTTTALANFTNTGTINITGSGTIAGITNNAGGIVNHSGSSTITSFNNATSTSTLNLSTTPTVPTFTTLTVTAAGNTVNYNGAGAQTIRTGNYQNLILSGSGVKTLQGGTTAIGGNLTLSGTASTTTVIGLTIAGNLNIGDGTTFTVAGFNLAVTGTTTIGAGTTGQINFTSTTGTKTFTGNVSIAANGTWNNTASEAVSFGADLAVGSSAAFTQGTGLVTFTGASSNTVSSVNTTLSFGGGITVNKGASQANVLDVTAVIALSSGGLTLTNGTFKLSSASTITAFTADPILSANTQLWCNGGTISSTSPLSFSGQLQISSGTVTVGSSSADYLFPDGGTINISGTGVLNVLGSLSDFPVALGAGMFFNMTGGTCTVGTGGSTFDDFAFAIGWSTNSTFTMSGGTIVIQNPQTYTGNPSFLAANKAGYFNIATSSNFTGGTLQIGNSSTTASSTMAIYTTNPIYNLTINNSSSSGEISGQGITVSNNFTISAGGFGTNGFSMTVGGNWTNNGTFTNGSGLVTLNGTTQSISGTSSTTFFDLTLAGSGTKTYSVATFVSDILTVNTGVVLKLGAITTHTAKRLILGGTPQAAGTYGSTSSAATNQNDTFFTVGFSGILTVSSGRIYYSAATGNWNSNSSWSTVTYGGAAATAFPVAGDDVNIGGGFTITVTAAAACATLSYLSNDTNTNLVNINSGIALDISGAITIPRGSNPNTNTLAVGAGTLTAASLAFTNSGTNQRHFLTISTGTATISGGVTTDGTSTSPTITFTGAGTLNLGGAFLNSSNATFTASTGTVNYNGTTTQTMGDFTYNNLTLTNSGIKNPFGAMTIGGNFTLNSGAVFSAGAYTHTLTGNWTNNGGTFTNTGSTFNFNGTSTQTIGGTSSTTFNNLTMSGSNTVSFSIATFIGGTLTQGTGTVINPNSITTHTARTYIQGGTPQAPGTFGSTSSSATNKSNTFFTSATTGILTVSNRIYFTRQTGNWNVNTTWSTVTFGNATNAGTFPVAGDDANIGGNVTTTVTAAAAAGSLSFQSGTNNTNLLQINSGITLAVSGGITIPRTNSNSNTLAVGAGTLTGGSLSFTNGGGGQRHILTISTGTVTIAGDITQVSSTGSATITFSGSGALNVAGAFLNSTNGTFTQSTGTVNYNGSSGAQTIGDFTYYNLTLNNTSSTIPQLTLFGNTAASNTLTMTSGVTNLAGFTLTLGSGGTASTLTRTSSTTTNWLYGGTFTRNWVASTSITSSSGNFYGLFPIGTSSSSSYRPLQINSTVSPTASGTYSVTHTSASTTTDLSPTFSDAGTTVQRIDDSQFVGSLATITDGTYNINVTMTGYLGTGSLSDIRLATFVSGTTATSVGTHTAATGTVINPTAGRTGLTATNLSNDFRIATTNLAATPLPIELIYFSAVLRNLMVELSWATASELNNDFFTIERSGSGEKFETVKTVKGKGTTNLKSIYQDIDEDPLPGISYYRLKQTDFDGNHTYSEVITIENNSATSQFKIYPNPIADNKFTLEMNGLCGSVEVPLSVINMQGVIVHQASYQSSASGTLKTVVELNAVPSGVYMAVINAATGLRKRIVIP